MTLDEVRELRTDIITPAQAAQVLKCDPAYIRVAAREGVFEFPAVLVGNRVKIPREAFVRYMEGRHDGL